MSKSKTMVGHVPRMVEMRNAYNIFVEGQIPPRDLGIVGIIILKRVYKKLGTGIRV
jgi:hypothetical protein